MVRRSWSSRTWRLLISSLSNRLEPLAHQTTRASSRARVRRASIEQLEGRSLMAFGLGDVAFSGFQSVTPDKLSIVLLTDVAAGSVLTISDNGWNGSALSSNEGNSVLTFQAPLSAGTQLNFDSLRNAGSKWAVGSSSAGLSDITGGNFSFSANGENLFAYDGSVAPTSNTDSRWVAAFATNSFLSSGLISTSTSYLPTIFASTSAFVSLGIPLAQTNENGAYTGGSASGTISQVRSILHQVSNWTTFTTAGAQPIPPNATFTITTSGNSSPNGLSLSRTSVLENAPISTIVGSLSTSDPDAGNTFTYSLVAGVGSTDNTLFQIQGNQVRTASIFDFETKSEYSVRLRTIDQGGLSFEQPFLIQIANLNEALDLRINEIKVAPPGSTASRNQYQYIELRGTPGASLNNVYLVMLDGNQSSSGTARYVRNLTGSSLGSNGLLMIKSPSGGHAASSGTAVVTDAQFDDPNGILSKESVTFYLATATAAFTQGLDYDQNDDGNLDNLPTGLALNDTVGWLDADSVDRVYGYVTLSQNLGVPAAATRFVNNTDILSEAWFNGGLLQTGNDPAQLTYDTARASANLPVSPLVARLTPGDGNFEEPTGDTNLRIVSYNITSAGGTGAPRSGLATILQAIGTEIVAGIAQPIDLLAIQEVASQNTTSAAVAAMLNSLYGAGIYAYGSLNGDTTGAGTQGVVYNTQSLRLLHEKEIGVASGTGQPRTTIRHHFETVADDGFTEFFVYNSHWKSADDTDGRNRRRLEAQNIRDDADLLGNGTNILYVGDFNLYDSFELAYQEMVGAGFGQAFDPINRPGNWHGTSSFRDIFTQAPSTSPPSGLTGGGLDDRFDFQLITGELLDGIGMEYRVGSYHSFGNNGSVPLNGNINDPSSTALSGLTNRTTVLNLLTTVSDHLPVVADYVFPAGPSTPLPPRLSTATDLGVSQSDHLTSETRPEFTGVATPGNQIAIYANDLLVAQGLVGSNGTYSLRPTTPMPAGTYSIKAEQINAANLRSAKSASMFPALNIDTTKPTASLAAITPTIRDTSIDAIQLIFSEPIAQIGLSQLNLAREGGGNRLTASQTLNSSDNGVSWTLGNLSTLNEESGRYTISFQRSGVTDRAGNPVDISPTVGGSFSRDFTLVLHAPTDISLAAESIVEDNQTTTLDRLVGTLSVLDSDAFDTHTYSLTNGDGDLDNAKFYINGDRVYLRQGELLDFETKPTYSIRVQVLDSIGNAFAKPLSLNLVDLNEPPTGIVLTNRIERLPESTSTSSALKIADVVVFDDALGTNSLQLSGVDAASFVIDGTSVYLRAGTTLDFETKNSYSASVTVDDGTVGSTPDASISFVLYLDDVAESSPPIINGFDTTVLFRENGVAVLLDTNATLSDSDSPDFNGGRLIASWIENGQVSDQLQIRHVGTNANQIGLNGQEVLWGGTRIGTWSGGTSGLNPLVVELQSSASPSAVQGLLRSLQYANASDNPLSLTRRVQVVIHDGDGGSSLPATKLLQVTAVNDRPIVNSAIGTASFIEDGPAVLLYPAAEVVDSDSPSFDLGLIQVRVATNPQPMDRLTIFSQGVSEDQIGVNGSVVTYGGVPVGTWAGTTTLTVQLNAAATPAIAQAILRQVQFSHLSGGPSELSRTITTSLRDGDGGVSLVSTSTVTMQAINDAPSIQAFDTNLLYKENGAPLLLDSNALVVDVDGLDFDLGTMTITLLNGEASDRLSLRHQGTLAGQVGVSGDTVSFGGTTIGSLSGGRSDSSPLVITFNAQARLAGVQAVLRNLTFANVSNTPSASPRTVQVSLTDGDGGVSPSVSKLISVTPVNDPPQIVGFDGQAQYIVGGPAVLLDEDVQLQDEDHSAFANGRLTVSLAANVQSTDRLRIQSQGDGLDQIRVSGLQIFYQGVLIGTWSGTTRLTILLNAEASIAATQKLIRSITFSSLSASPSLLTRTVSMTLSDGVTVSGLVSKQIQLS